MSLRARHGVCALAAVLVLLPPLCGSPLPPPPTPPPPASRRPANAARIRAPNTSWTVSGLSGGAFMAHQFHVAFSSQVSGAAIVAGGPFFCAQDSVLIAQGACMAAPQRISVPALVAITANTALTGTIDPPRHLANASVYLFSGSKDTTVHPGVVRKLETYLGHYIAEPTQLRAEYDVPAEHAWVTERFGSACAVNGPPYINRCNFSLAFHALSHILGAAAINRSEFVDRNLRTFSQVPFALGRVPAATGLDEQGFAYVPTACQAATERCRLHIAFHGCDQGRSFVGDTFARHSGLSELAEANGIVVLFPQAVPSAVPLNPKGCWDWWGLCASAVQALRCMLLKC